MEKYHQQEINKRFSRAREASNTKCLHMSPKDYGYKANDIEVNGNNIKFVFSEDNETEEADIILDFPKWYICWSKGEPSVKLFAIHKFYRSVSPLVEFEDTEEGGRLWTVENYDSVKSLKKLIETGYVYPRCTQSGLWFTDR